MPGWRRCNPPPAFADSKPRMKKRSENRCGLTLLELLVVLVVLAALAGILLSRLSGDLRLNAGGREWTAQETATQTTLNVVRDAILGGNTETPGYREDVGTMPGILADLFRQPVGVPDFDPAYRRGWRGPYLQHQGARYSVDPTRNFTADYGANGDPAVLDAWGNPVVIQQAGTPNIRLVSAGSDGVLHTLNDTDGTNRNDDVVLFLLREDPLP